jgi:hypothetical protein
LSGRLARGLAAMAFDRQVTVAAVETLADGWRGLGGATIPFHLQGPGFRLSTISLTGGLLGGFKSALGAHLRAQDLVAPNDLSPLRG